MFHFFRGVLVSLFLLINFYVFAQVNTAINLTPLTPSVICSSGNDTVKYSVSASNIPPNTNVVIYQSQDSLFNPYNNEGDSIAFIPGNALPADTVNFKSCVRVLGIFIDACGASGTEPRNEYIILTSGSGVGVSRITIDYDPANSNSGNNNDNDINRGANPCSFKTPDATLINNLRTGSCNAANIIPASPTDSIPANAIILCFTSDQVTANYNVNGLCNLGYPIYVVQSSCTRTVGAFTNAPSCSTTPTTRYRRTTVTDLNQNCSHNFVYDRCGLFDLDGTYAITQDGIDTASVANNGIRRNTADPCGGIDYSQLSFNSDTTLTIALNNNNCNTGKYFIKAITNPPGSQPVSNAISYQLVCNNVRAVSSTTNICSGDSVIIDISSSDPNAILSWTVQGSSTISGAVNGTGNSVRQVLSYSGSTKDSVIYTVISSDAGCIKTQEVKVVVSNCQRCLPDFLIPDTVCVNDEIRISNLTDENCASSYYWNFCSGNLSSVPSGFNIGNLGGEFEFPVFIELVQNGNEKYAFVVNHITGNGQAELIRLKFGNSYLNTPIVTNLGDLGISGFIYGEGIQIKKDGNNWYGLILAGRIENPKVIRLNFGNNIENNPSITDFGNIGNLEFSYDVQIFQIGTNWHSFITNTTNNTITRLDFGNSLGNNPVATNIGGFGVLTSPNGMNLIVENGSHYLFVVNYNGDIVRLNFGNSYLNVNPSVSNLGNLGQLNKSRMLRILNDCGSYFGVIANDDNYLTKLEFPNGIIGDPIASNLGNIGNLDFPHSLSSIFRERDSLYLFIPNVNSNSLTRIVYGNCSNSSIPSTTLQNPPLFSYNLPGVYNISLSINEELLGQSSTVCKQIVVIDTIKKPVATINNVVCSTDTIRLNVQNIEQGVTYVWEGPNGFNSTIPNISIEIPNGSLSGVYVVTASGRCNSKKDTVSYLIENLSQFSLGNDTAYCGEFSKVLSTGIQSTQWSTQQTGAQITVTEGGTYIATVSNECGSVSDTITITKFNLPIVNLGRDTAICDGQIQLQLQQEFETYLWSTGSQAPGITVTEEGIYFVLVTDEKGCKGSDTIQIANNCAAELFIPNAFSPNGDGVNDVFLVRGNSRNTIIEKMIIYNRWGNKVFEASNILPNDVSAGWDGKYKGTFAQNEVYGYYVVAKFSDGTQKVLKGNVTLLR